MTPNLAAYYVIAAPTMRPAYSVAAVVFVV